MVFTSAPQSTFTVMGMLPFLLLSEELYLSWYDHEKLYQLVICLLPH